MSEEDHFLIARTWSGTVRSRDADAYAQYIRETGFDEYAQTEGNRGAWMLRRDEGETTEFLTLSLWEDEDAIRRFAGEDIEAAVLYPGDEDYLLGPSTVTHHQVVAELGRGS
jgi:heme-degrading monooxygenase HmoA